MVDDSILSRLISLWLAYPTSFLRKFNHMRTNNPQFSYVTAGMALAREVISTEVQAGGTARATVGFLPRFFASARDGLAAFMSEKFDFYKAVHLEVEQDKILEKLAGVNFATLASLPVVALEGFEGQYLDYGKQVLMGFSFYEDYTAKDIAAYRKLLGAILSNKSARIDLRDVTQSHKAAARACDEIEKSVATFFVRGSHIAQTTVGVIASRTSDLNYIFQDAQAIIKKVKEIDPKSVQNAVKEVNDLAALLVEEIEQGTIGDLSGAQLNNLIEGLMALGRQVEFFALTYYRATTYIAAVDRLTQVLKKV